MKFFFRWYWNSLRYRLGLTNLSPAGHEFRRMMLNLGYKELQ